MEPVEQTGLMQPSPPLQQCPYRGDTAQLPTLKKKYTYSIERRREYERRYQAKHPGGRNAITAKYTKTHPEVYTASAKRYQNKLKASRDELVDLKAKLLAANIVI